ncbi:MAG: hypothetical protein JF616_15055 [Fibrobacteres bacterium]|jgi:hypothetical protein|nr:hypothetical protein [Fibrobacterota bacterium]
MRATVLFLGLALQAAQAGGNGISPPDSSARREPGSELDFLINDDAKPQVPAPKPQPGRAWIYWAAAGAAACGGIGWYWYESNAKPAVSRNDQLFTDAQ